jgi:glutaredoxin 2
MKTTLTTRMTALMVAGLLTVVTNGSVLQNFDAVAHNAVSVHKAQAPVLVKLDTVTIIAKANA